MATLTAARAASTFPVAKTVGGGVLHAAWGTIEITGNFTAGDIVEMCRVPAGAVVTGGFLYGDDIDTNAAETLNISVGWAANGVDVASAAGLGALGVLSVDTVPGIKPEGGLMYPLGGVLIIDGPKTFAAETVIQLTIVAASATFVAGTLSLVVHYLNP